MHFSFVRNLRGNQGILKQEFSRRNSHEGILTKEFSRRNSHEGILKQVFSGKNSSGGGVFISTKTTGIHDYRVMKTSTSHPIQKIEQRTHGNIFGQGVRFGHHRSNYIGVLRVQILHTTVCAARQLGYG